MTSKLLAIVTLETEDIPNYIYIYEDDDIELLISAFCELNQIKEEGKQFIISEIKNNLKQVNRSTLDIIVQDEYQDQQSSNKDIQDQLIKNNQICEQQNNHHLFNTKLTLDKLYNIDQLQINSIENRQSLHNETINQSNLIEQQYCNGIVNYNYKKIKSSICPNNRYGNTSQQTKERLTSIYNIQNDYQQTNKRKKIFDTDQPKIKYKQDLELIRYIFRQLDNDGDGYISYESINLKIEEQYLQLIAPVLFHMQEQRMVLDFDSFVYLIISFNILIY